MPGGLQSKNAYGIRNSMSTTLTPSLIVEQRRKNGWSQKRLADMVCVNQGTVSKWESGRLVPNGAEAKLLEMVFAGEVTA